VHPATNMAMIAFCGGDDKATWEGGGGEPRGHIAIHRWFGSERSTDLTEHGRPDKRDDWSNYVFCHSGGEGNATEFEKVDLDDDRFRIKMVGGPDGAQWDGEAWLAAHQYYDNDARDDYSCWLMAHRNEAAGSIFKKHSHHGYFKLEIVGCDDDCKWNDGHGWVCCHRFDGCADARDGCSNYLIVHKNEDCASIFHLS